MDLNNIKKIGAFEKTPQKTDKKQQNKQSEAKKHPVIEFLFFTETQKQENIIKEIKEILNEQKTTQKKKRRIYS